MANVVVTGASGGIGAALAKELVSRGDRVVLAARREKELTDEARALGANAIPVVCDVTKRSDVERLAKESIAKLGHVDAWINNAGQGITRLVMELTDEDVDVMISVNVKSALYGMQAIAPHMKSRKKGHIVNISSLLGRIPLAPVRSVYSASKAALNSLTTNARAELAPDGVDVSLVMPGLVATEFAQNSRNAGPPGTPAAPPPGPPGSPAMVRQTAEEVAKAIADLLATPRPELFTNPVHAEMVKGYYADVAAFEARARA